ncbi:3-hydroxyacyl-CoA dehydrogenase NAD-binding domain-containing protein [Brevifollis gellanilyticus]|uniref:enoyl-CoA hydratase n=1 Tax=Brevifollis gellanilyticus TaxID=748831 RepID=A0A512MG55_9BACT|nr:3-hydroxyacyl-CoA dehydrogenase NAD-binding domain-containing protein [Brevifollis gellanilyticus]GEP45717.1 fatty acid oxidation complex subunit alpha [Brevifollis gellanilyticus]
MKTHLLESLVIHPESEHSDAPLKHFRLEVDADHWAWITFDMAGSSANVWNTTTLREFNHCLDHVVHDSSVKGLFIRSAKDKVFIAGADLKTLRSSAARKLEELIDLGQATFNRLASMKMPKIALIHGACVGGGLELTLACDARIASDSDYTRLGLPETQIGLIPAWGGSTRLPKLLGLPKALDLILTGKLLKPSEAKRVGLVSAVAPREHLETVAKKMMSEVEHEMPVARFRDRLFAPFIASKARSVLHHKMRGLYAAPFRALEVVRRAPFTSMAKAMELEKHAILDLALTPETERLIDFFFRKEDASKKPWPTGVALTVHDVTVIGAGVMGSGIAHWIATRGNKVLMQDISTESLGKGIERIKGLLDEGLKRRAITKQNLRDTMDRIIPEHERVPLNHQQLVIEAATESMGVKKKIFADLAARASNDTILATNTSALSVRELAETVPHPERVIGLHFFNPVHRMPLVEIITTPHTSDDVIATMVSFVQRLGKVPVVVSDSPGFIVNRILVPYLMEAVHLHESGVPAELIDEAMLDYGMPMGPMRLLDEIGLDVAAHVGRTLDEAFPGRFAKTSMIHDMISQGKLGKKTGEGFYTYPDKHSHHTSFSEADHHLMERVRERLGGLIGEEARRISEEGIARSNEDIELAMTLGTGFPVLRPLLSPSMH